MPELPEVETVKETLKKLVVNKQINNVNIYYDKIIEFPTCDDFKKNLIGETIVDIKRRGKWLMFELKNYFLLSHLRMEGKYLFREIGSEVTKHEHISFILDDCELRYKDTRKFGRMYLFKKDEAFNNKPLNELGKEPFDETLDVTYLKTKYAKKRLPIKTVLLDQSIIVGIGNIYDDEVLFLSQINPLTQANMLTNEQLQKIIDNTKSVLTKAINLGGTTIRSYESSEGVHGRFQNELLIHGRSGQCIICGSEIVKIKVGGRGTYYCPSCQK